MSTNNNSVTIYSDSSLIDSAEGRIHTWIEVSDGVNPPIVYSFDAEGGGVFKPIGGTDQRKQIADKTTIPITQDQYDDMVEKGTTLDKAAKAGNYDYTLLPGYTGDGNNCVTAATEILDSVGIKVLNDSKTPGQASGIIKYLDKYGPDSLNNPDKREFVTATSGLYDGNPEMTEKFWQACNNEGNNYLLDKVSDILDAMNDFFVKEQVPWNKDNTFYVPDGNGGYMINELHKDYLASLNSFTVRRRDPLSIDLDGDGVETVSTENVVYFDLNKNGFAEKMGWGGVSNKMIIPVS